MHKFEKANFNIDQYDETENYGRFVIEPLERGFGTTLGNALRRVLLSSLPGSAVYAIKVQGAIHEFSAIDGVVEDVTTMILNLKKLVFDVDSEDTATMIIDVKGPATVTGADIQCPAEVKMISNDLVIAHVAEGGHLYMELFAKKDRGYVSADQNKVNINTIGVIPTDSRFWCCSSTSGPAAGPPCICSASTARRSRTRCSTSGCSAMCWATPGGSTS